MLSLGLRAERDSEWLETSAGSWRWSRKFLGWDLAPACHRWRWRWGWIQAHFRFGEVNHTFNIMLHHVTSMFESSKTYTVQLCTTSFPILSRFSLPGGCQQGSWSGQDQPWRDAVLGEGATRRKMWSLFCHQKSMGLRGKKKHLEFGNTCGIHHFSLFVFFLLKNCSQRCWSRGKMLLLRSWWTLLKMGTAKLASSQDKSMIWEFDVLRGEP